MIDALDIILTWTQCQLQCNTNRADAQSTPTCPWLPPGARLQRRDMSENDAVLVEIYGSMVRRVIGLLSGENGQADAVKLRRMRGHM